MPDARQVMREAMDERGLQEAIVRTARLHGWLVHHDPASEDPDGRWRTRLHGDRGFPDLVLARAGIVIIVECKTEHGRFGPGQKEWLGALGAKVVRPRDLDALLVRLMVPPAIVIQGLTSPPNRDTVVVPTSHPGRKPGGGPD